MKTSPSWVSVLLYFVSSELASKTGSLERIQSRGSARRVLKRRGRYRDGGKRVGRQANSIGGGVWKSVFLVCGPGVEFGRNTRIFVFDRPYLTWSEYLGLASEFLSPGSWTVSV